MVSVRGTSYGSYESTHASDRSGVREAIDGGQDGVRPCLAAAHQYMPTPVMLELCSLVIIVTRQVWNMAAEILRQLLVYATAERPNVIRRDTPWKHVTVRELPKDLTFEVNCSRNPLNWSDLENR